MMKLCSLYTLTCHLHGPLGCVLLLTQYSTPMSLCVPVPHRCKVICWDPDGAHEVVVKVTEKKLADPHP